MKTPPFSLSHVSRGITRVLYFPAISWSAAILRLLTSAGNAWFVGHQIAIQLKKEFDVNLGVVFCDNNNQNCTHSWDEAQAENLSARTVDWGPAEFIGLFFGISAFLVMAASRLPALSNEIKKTNIEQFAKEIGFESPLPPANLSPALRIGIGVSTTSCLLSGMLGLVMIASRVSHQQHGKDINLFCLYPPAITVTLAVFGAVSTFIPFRAYVIGMTKRASILLQLLEGEDKKFLNFSRLSYPERAMVLSTNALYAFYFFHTVNYILHCFFGEENNNTTFNAISAGTAIASLLVSVPVTILCRMAKQRCESSEMLTILKKGLPCISNRNGSEMAENQPTRLYRDIQDQQKFFNTLAETLSTTYKTTEESDSEHDYLQAIFTNTLSVQHNEGSFAVEAKLYLLNERLSLVLSQHEKTKNEFDDLAYLGRKIAGLTRYRTAHPTRETEITENYTTIVKALSSIDRIAELKALKALKAKIKNAADSLFKKKGNPKISILQHFSDCLDEKSWRHIRSDIRDYEKNPDVFDNNHYVVKLNKYLNASNASQKNPYSQDTLEETILDSNTLDPCQEKTHDTDLCGAIDIEVEKEETLQDSILDTCPKPLQNILETQRKNDHETTTTLTETALDSATLENGVSTNLRAAITNLNDASIAIIANALGEAHKALVKDSGKKSRALRVFPGYFGMTLGLPLLFIDVLQTLVGTLLSQFVFFKFALAGLSKLPHLDRLSPDHKDVKITLAVVSTILAINTAYFLISYSILDSYKTLRSAFLKADKGLEKCGRGCCPCFSSTTKEGYDIVYNGVFDNPEDQEALEPSKQPTYGTQHTAEGGPTDDTYISDDYTSDDNDSDAQNLPIPTGTVGATPSPTEVKVCPIADGGTPPSETSELTTSPAVHVKSISSNAQKQPQAGNTSAQSNLALLLSDSTIDSDEDPTNSSYSLNADTGTQVQHADPSKRKGRWHDFFKSRENNEGEDTPYTPLLGT